MAMDRSLVLITAPTAATVTLDEAKAQLRNATENDAFLQSILDACVNQLDPAAGGWLGRALRPQTWELRLSSFIGITRYHQGNHHDASGLRHQIYLPCPPLTAITSVTYDDLSGVSHTLVQDTDFKVFGLGTLGRQSIAPIYGSFWPAARPYPESVRIRFSSGYALTPTDVMPAPIKQAVLLGIKGLYDLGARNAFLTTDTVIGVTSRSFSVTDAAVAVMQNAAENLLSTYRVWN